MGLEERFPSSLPCPLGCRFDAVLLEDVSDGLIGDRVTEIGQGTLDSVLSQTGYRIDVSRHPATSIGFACRSAVSRRRPQPSRPPIAGNRAAVAYRQPATSHAAVRTVSLPRRCVSTGQTNGVSGASSRTVAALEIRHVSDATRGRCLPPLPPCHRQRVPDAVPLSQVGRGFPIVQSVPYPRPRREVLSRFRRDH